MRSGTTTRTFTNIGAMLREKMKSDTSYETAMKDFLGRRPKKLRATAGRFPKRHDLHVRK